MGAYDTRGYLFSDLDLRAVMEAQRSQIDAEVNALDANRLLNTSEEDLVKFFIDKYWIDAPTLRRDEWVADSKEAHTTVNDYGHTITIPVTRIEIEVPFDGERELFRARESQFTLSPPRAEIRAQSLLLTFEVRLEARGDLRPQIDRELNEIEKHLEWIRSDVAKHNNALRRVAEQSVRRRRDRILATQGSRPRWASPFVREWMPRLLTLLLRFGRRSHLHCHQLLLPHT